MNLKDKYIGSVKLAAIGDALGWITEFEKSRNNLKIKYGTDYIIKFYDWEKKVGGRFNGYIDYIKKGSYSDDTQLLLSVARSIKQNGFLDKEYFSKIELPAWLMYSRGAGRTIKNAARKIMRKSAKWNNNYFTYNSGKTKLDYRDSGANGAAMRILPIPLANLGNVGKINEEIFANSIATHGHPRAIIAAMLYGNAVNLVLQLKPEKYDYSSLLVELGKDINLKLSIPFIDKPLYRYWESQWNNKAKVAFRKLFEYTLNETQEYLRITYKSLLSNTSDDETLSKLGCYSDESKGSGISTVIAGIYLSCKYNNEPLKSIEQAVNMLGADTDSIAAFAGGMVGALHGQTIIPEEWKIVQDYDYLDKVANGLLDVANNKHVNQAKENVNSLDLFNDFSSDSFDKGDQIIFNPLGKGIITNIDRQKTLTNGKYNLIVDVEFKIGQSCRFSKLLKEK